MILSKKNIVDILQTMREHEIKPGVVQSVRQAKKMTSVDPTGRKWKVGDEFYRIEFFSGTNYVSDDTTPTS